MSHTDDETTDSTATGEDFRVSLSGSNSEYPREILRDIRHLFQRLLVEIARHAGVANPELLQRFSEALGAGYDELIVAKRGAFEQITGLTASRITLMCDSDLGFEIRIGEIVKRLGDVGGNALWRTQLRYITLLRRPDMTPADNPVGLDVIGLGLWEICRSSGLSVDQNLDLLDRLEEQLTAELPELYRSLNELLAGHSIEPAQTKKIANLAPRPITQVAPGVPAGNMVSSANLEAGSNTLSTLQSLLIQQRCSAQGTGTLFGQGLVAGAAVNPALEAATRIMLNQLAGRLDRLQAAGRAASPETMDVQPRVVRAKELGLQPGRPEAVSLDTMALIFEAFFASGELPDTIKTAIARLQIPLLKLAVFDATLFSDTKHPARRLIDGLARSVLGLPHDVSRTHPVCKRVWQVVETVAETLQRDASALTVPLTELETLIAQRNAEVLAGAEPYLPLFDGLAAGELAAEAARRWLHSLETRGAAQEILDFARQHWVHVMEAACLDGGEAGSLWQDGQTTIADLLWSVQPMVNPDDRKLLVRMVPTLLKRINEGLDRIGRTADERSGFLDACFTLQTAALRGNPPVPVLPAESSPVLTRELVVTWHESDGKRLKTLSFSGTPASAYRRAASGVDGVQAGSWLKFEIGDGQPLCGLVCRSHPSAGSALLFNPDWDYAVVVSPDVLAMQLREDKAKVVSAVSIFDIAAQRALDGMVAG